MDAHMADAFRQLTFVSQCCPELGDRLHTAIGASAREMEIRNGSHGFMFHTIRITRSVVAMTFVSCTKGRLKTRRPITLTRRSRLRRSRLRRSRLRRSHPRRSRLRRSRLRRSRLRRSRLRRDRLRRDRLRPNRRHPNRLRLNRRHPSRPRLNRRHPSRPRLNRRHPNRLHPNRLHPNRQHPNRQHPNRPRRNRLRPNHLRRDRLQAVLWPAAVKQNSEKVHRADRMKRAGRAQHCQLQFPGQEVTMISRHDRTNTLVALAMWVG
ncbi:pentapeptide repeat-containing protein [Paraburkholderia sediminicola]|uniref:pentapeptide repeat-containing protein n=1 Tax=Paraburkholderia sediminicola TaxID=458836 RepID=UPI0038B7CCD8